MLNAGITPGRARVRLARLLGRPRAARRTAPWRSWARARCATRDGVLMPRRRGPAAAGISPVELREKEGLALVNGTDGMLGMLVLAIDRPAPLLTRADIAAAMSVEALLGTDAVFAADLMASGRIPARPRRPRTSGHARRQRDHGQPSRTRVHPGAGRLLAALRAAGARRRPATRSSTPRTVAARELAAAVDNPVVTLDGRVESNGNFHGAPVGYVLDFLAIAVADVARMRERRTDRFLDVARSHGLPPSSPTTPASTPGHMIAQYTAAGIVSELKRLAVPASRRLDPVVGDAGGPRLDGLGRRPQAAPRDRRPRPGARDRAAHRGPRHRPARPAAAGAGHRRRARTLRAAGVAGPGPDRFLAPEIETAVQLVATGALSPERRPSPARSPEPSRPEQAHGSRAHGTHRPGHDTV